jgi:hypothetical protein
MKSNTIDIIGQKVIIEASGTAKQKNGRPYNNRYGSRLLKHTCR